jgi:hypothetical protein
MIDEAVRSILINNSTVYGLIGTRIYPLVLPLSCSFPAISYSKPSDPYTRIARSPRFQIDMWSKDFTEVQNVKNAVETALDGYSGIISGINIEKIIPLDSHDFTLDDTQLNRVSYDFKVIYRSL